MPKQEKGLMHGFQMVCNFQSYILILQWVNLPAANKMMPPRYQDIQPEDIPVVKLDNGVSIKLMAGEVNETKGASNNIFWNKSILMFFSQRYRNRSNLRRHHCSSKLCLHSSYHSWSQCIHLRNRRGGKFWTCGQSKESHCTLFRK
jgi:hypothetical protein